MKIIPLSIAKSYVSHWSWWEGIRELLQNAVDTGDFDVQTTWSRQIIINSRGGKIPVSALLMGKSGKEDDEDTIGKFGEGMKLAFLVLGRLGADVVVHNDDECWRPSFQYSETFQEECLAVGVYPAEEATGDVRICISGVPEEIIELVEDRFLPIKELHRSTLPTMVRLMRKMRMTKAVVFMLMVSSLPRLKVSISLTTTSVQVLSP